MTVPSIADSIAYQQAELTVEESAIAFDKSVEDTPEGDAAEAAWIAANAALRAVIDAHVAEQVAAAVNGQ